MRIAIWQTGESLREARGLQRLRVRAGEAADANVRVLVVPECFASGYHIPDMTQAAQPSAGDWHDEVAAVASEFDLAIVYGFPEAVGDAVDNGAVYNTVHWVDPGGDVRAAYRKTHLYGDLDRSMFEPGDTASAIFDVDGLNVGLLICYDVEFPETVRALALAGADLVVVPTALMEPADVVARSVVSTRALENQIFLAYANRVGQEQKLTYVGLSCVVGPDGADLARAGSGDELVVADLDPAMLAATRADYNQLRDRRPELYRALTS